MAKKKVICQKTNSIAAVVVISIVAMATHTHTCAHYTKIPIELFVSKNTHSEQCTYVCMCALLYLCTGTSRTVIPQPYSYTVTHAHLSRLRLVYWTDHRVEMRDA